MLECCIELHSSLSHAPYQNVTKRHLTKLDPVVIFIYFIPYLKDTECKCLQEKIFKQTQVSYIFKLATETQMPDFESNFPTVACSCQVQLKQSNMTKTSLAGHRVHSGSQELCTWWKRQNNLGRGGPTQGSCSGYRQVLNSHNRVSYKFKQAKLQAAIAKRTKNILNQNNSWVGTGHVIKQNMTFLQLAKLKSMITSKNRSYLQSTNCHHTKIFVTKNMAEMKSDGGDGCVSGS